MEEFSQQEDRLCLNVPDPNTYYLTFEFMLTSPDVNRGTSCNGQGGQV